MKIISTEKAPLPLGHYSQGIEHAGLIHVCGQLPIHPSDESVQPQSMADQVTLTLENLLAVVEAGGGSKSSIIKVNLYISDLSHWPEANEAFAAFFGDHKPARTAVPAPAIPKGFMVEIDGVAAVL